MDDNLVIQVEVKQSKYHCVSHSIQVLELGLMYFSLNAKGSVHAQKGIWSVQFLYLEGASKISDKSHSSEFRNTNEVRKVT